MTPEKFLSFGLSIIPCHSGTNTDNDKRPCIKWKEFQTTLPTTQQLHAWQLKWPEANWAIITGKLSGIVVLEIDSEEGEKFCAEHGLPETVSVQSKRGRHLYFHAPVIDVRNWEKRIPGCDFRGNGGYVIAPGSRHKSGFIYAWINSIEDVELADMPEWLLEICKQPEIEREEIKIVAQTDDPSAVAYASKVLDDEIRLLGETKHGARESATFKTSARLYEFVAGGYLLDADVDAKLHDAIHAYDRYTEFPVQWDDIEQTIANGRKAGMKHPVRIPILPITYGNGVAAHEPTPPNGIPPHEELQPEPEPIFTLDDTGNGQRFAWRYRDEVLYDHLQEKWFIYDDMRFAKDEVMDIHLLAKSITLEMRAQYRREDFKPGKVWASKSRDRGRISSMIYLASSEPEIKVKTADLDCDPYLFNVMNGTLDLHSLEIKFIEHSPLHRLTKLAPCDYDPEAIAPTFLNVLTRALPDENVRAYFQTRIAQSLVANILSREYYICYGSGANSKSTLLEYAFLPMFGDYGMPVMSSTFHIRQSEEGPRADLVDLAGVRYVLARESNAEKALDEALIKTVTSGDAIKARRPHSPNDITFSPVFYVWMQTNHKPLITGVDPAIWDRTKLFEFGVRIPESERDPTLKEKLSYELSGILNWALEGLRLQREGNVKEPAGVREATEQFRIESDVIGDFFERCIITGDSLRVSNGILSECYSKYCRENDDTPVSKKKFAKYLTDKGFRKSTGGSTRYWFGFALKEERNNAHELDLKPARKENDSQPF